MDKFRAIEYFIAAAHEKSFSGAARHFDVSVTAVAKLVAALERELNQAMFERSPQGLTLTAAGERYLEACIPALEQLHEAAQSSRDSGERQPGTVVVGVQQVIANGCLTRALPRFHARYPEISLDVREFQRMTPEETNGVDVFLMVGWPQFPNLVHRRIGAGRFIVVAAPQYWSRHGMPQRPKDLERHVCLPLRSVDGTAMDLWSFTRGDEHESVTARGWLVTSNPHREITMQLTLAGEGVMRVLDWTNIDSLANGVLVRALSDWVSPEAPPVNLLYRPSARRNPRVRVFNEFVIDLFRELEALRGQKVPASGRPYWFGRRYGKSSVMLSRPVASS